MGQAPDDIATIAGKGLTGPESLTLAEIQSLCGWALPNLDTPPARTMSDEGRVGRQARKRRSFVSKIERFERPLGLAEFWRLPGTLGLNARERRTPPS